MTSPTPTSQAEQLVRRWLDEDQRIGRMTGTLETGRLVKRITDALTTAHAEGVRDGLERGAKIADRNGSATCTCDTKHGYGKHPHQTYCCYGISTAIRRAQERGDAP